MISCCSDLSPPPSIRMESRHSGQFTLWFDSIDLGSSSSIHSAGSVQADSLPFWEELAGGVLSFSQAIFQITPRFGLSNSSCIRVNLIGLFSQRYF